MADESITRHTAKRIPSIVIGVVLAQIALLGGWGLSVDRRVTTLEVQESHSHEDIAEMKSDIKELLRRMPNAQ